jgi:putative PIN family toxin of toxin-antitoxin system
MKVVFDTNVLVSAFIVPGGKGEEALMLAIHRMIDLYTSVAILTETTHILRTKFDQPERDAVTALKLISRAATIVRPARTIHVLEDLPDNRILECAVAAQADLVVTGDHHILTLKQFEGIPIVRLVDFLRMMPRE